MIPYGRQDITQDDIDSVIEVLKSDFLTQGPKVPLFEQAVAKKVGSEYAVAANSATSALHIACLALDLGPGDRLWTSPITFVASANCGLYCGATVDFVDIDPQTYNLCPKALEEKLIQAKNHNRLPKIVVPVHLCGQSCDMRRIHELSKQYNFKIIEDASHAIGGEYFGSPIGGCKYSDITVFSFHPVKIITTAEGGIATTNQSNLASKMDLYRSHGVTRDPSLMKYESDGSWYYEQIELGYNYRMTELHAALGISQMTRLDEYVACRHSLAYRYNDMLADLPVVVPWQHPDSYSSLHLYVIRLRLDHINSSHRKVFEELRALGIGVNLHYMPVYNHPYYQKLGLESEKFPEAERYYAEAISLPLFPLLTEIQQDQVVDALRASL